MAILPRNPKTVHESFVLNISFAFIKLSSKHERKSCPHHTLNNQLSYYVSSVGILMYIPQMPTHKISSHRTCVIGVLLKEGQSLC